MTEEEKLELLSELMEEDELSPETLLESVDYDSLVIMSLVALMKQNYDKQVSAKEFAQMKTVGQLMSIMTKD